MMEPIEAVLPYVVPGETAYFYPTNRSASYWPIVEHRVQIHDARAASDRLSLETTGFAAVRHRTDVVNFYDPEEVRSVYIPEIQALVKQLTGAERVLAFGAMVRSDAPATADGNQPSRGCHVDYDERTVRWWVKSLVPADEAEQLLSRRFMLMNLWRPIKTVERTPLALCDASTVERGDLHSSEIRGGLGDPNRPTMYGFNLSHSPRHRWYYLPRMQPDEIVAFKLCDSDTSRVQWTGHTAFDDPTSPPDAAPRESIEIRTISFFGA